MANANDNPDRFVTEAEAAALLGFAPRTLQFWRQQHRGPEFIRISPRANRYQLADVIAWARSRRTHGNEVHAG